MRAVEHVGVVGAGTMGAGIAQVAALGGYETRLYDPAPAALETGIERLHRAMAKGASKGLWTDKEADAASGKVGAAASFGDLAECDLVVEAAPEDLELKRELFGKLATLCSSETILASNTSSLPVSAIAAGIPHRERIVGMHFFNPPALMKLVEVVATEHSSEEALEATEEVGLRMGRTPIRAKDCPGFIANRLARPFTLESLRMLGDGLADVETIDRVCRQGGGFRMGPFELIDLIGLDVNLSVARSFYAQGGKPERWRPSPIQEHLVAEGRLGRKSGIGFYAYEVARSGPHAPLHRSVRSDSGAEQPLGPTMDEAALAGIDPAAPQVLSRLLAQIVNEAAYAGEEKVGAAEDMNTAMRLGFNWPLGPLEFGELVGGSRTVEILRALQGTHGEAYAPAPQLLTL